LYRITTAPLFHTAEAKISRRMQFHDKQKCAYCVIGGEIFELLKEFIQFMYPGGLHHVY
jgi:hypothetical protein